MSTSNATPFLCRFWEEDGVWNGVAQDLPVAVFGETLDEALDNMKAALESHFAAVSRAGEAERTLEHLKARAAEYGWLSLNDLSPDAPLVKFLAAVRNHELVAVI